MRGAIMAMRLRAAPQRYTRGQDYGWHRRVERWFLGLIDRGFGQTQIAQLMRRNGLL